MISSPLASFLHHGSWLIANGIEELPRDGEKLDELAALIRPSVSPYFKYAPVYDLIVKLANNTR
jgi:hypothetical protein